MTGIDDLRTTLDQHANAVADHAVEARSSAVHRRVRGVRRRRRAGVAGGVVAALAVVGAVTFLPRGETPAPDPADVVGVTAPPTLSSLGYVFDFDSSVPGTDGTVSIDLAASSRARLVSWATSGRDQDVRLTSDLDDPTTRHSDDFGDWVLVPPGVATTVTVEAVAGNAGLAVYNFDTTQRPAGITSDGVTYRQRVAGNRLIAAAIGAPGETAVTASGKTDALDSTIYLYCTGAPRGAWLALDAGEESGNPGGVQCGDDAVPYDGSDVPYESGAAPSNGRLTVNARLLDGPRGKPITEARGVRIGIGAYENNDLAESTGGGYAPELTESGGHLWRRIDDVAQLSSASITSRTPAEDGPYLVLGYGTVTGRFQLTVGDITGAQQQGGGSSSTIADADVPLEIKVRGGSGSIGIAVYERAD